MDVSIELPEILEFGDPLLLELDDPLLLELDDPPLLELDEFWLPSVDDTLEPAELPLVELDELAAIETETSWARATCVDEAPSRLAATTVAPARSRTPPDRAIRRAGKLFIRFCMRYLAIKPLHESVRTVQVYSLTAQ